MARRLVAVAWVGVLVVAVVGLARTGGGALAPPPATPEGWSAWAADRTPLEAAAAVLRLVAVVAAGYLLAVTAVALTAALLRRQRTVAVVARLSPPVVRWLLGASLAGVLVAGPAGASAASPPPTMVLLPDEPPTTTTTATTPTPPPAAWPPAAVPLPRTTVTLGPGDHLWSVAARTLATAWGRAPSEREVAPYWRSVVQLNRAGLPNPADPDLVFPGEVVHLPPVP
jgi:hypothetical protein